MALNGPIRRIAVVRLGGPTDNVRRYRLARLDEVAMASPHSSGQSEDAERAGDEPEPPPEDE